MAREKSHTHTHTHTHVQAHKQKIFSFDAQQDNMAGIRVQIRLIGSAAIGVRLTKAYTLRCKCPHRKQLRSVRSS